MKKHVNIGLIGFGVVGSGTMQLLKQHKKDVEARVGTPVKVTWVCSRSRKKSKWIGKNVRQTRNWRDVVSDPDVDFIIELMGGTQPAKQVIMAALRADKHVVTANKAVLAKHWNDIFGLARKRRKLVYFEASVGGGVPVIQALNEGLAGNDVKKIVGILNGTTNFILTRMADTEANFQDVLSLAQKSGLAEANPAFDVDGTDAAQKLSILSSLALGKWISPQHVYVEGIRNIKPLDIRLIKEHLNCLIKLVAIAEKTKKGWIFRVHPTLVSKKHPFATVRNEYNAVSIEGDSVNDVMLYGKGAGQLPTASAVLSDIIFLSRHVVQGTGEHLPYVTQHLHRKIQFAKMDQLETKYYLRLTVADKPGVLAKITSIIGQHNVSLSSVHQDVNDDVRYGYVDVILLTHDALESNVRKAVNQINRLSSTKSKPVVLRME